MRTRPKSVRWFVPVVVIVLLLFYWTIIHRMVIPDHSPSQSRQPRAVEESRFSALPHHSEQLYSVETFWSPVANPRGVLWLFHGCNHAGDHFFQFPEGQEIIRHAMQEHLIPVAFSSSDRTGSQCWNANRMGGSDLPHVAQAMQHLVQREGWQSMVHIGLGVSSGGYFLPHLPAMTKSFMQFQALILMISPGAPQVFRELTPVSQFPKIAWVSLTLDQRTEEMMQQSSLLLQQNEIPTRLWSLDIRTPITTELLLQRIPIDRERANEILSLLQEHHLVDDEGYLTSPTQWQSILFSSSLFQAEHKEFYLEAFANAFGFHEITSQAIDEIIVWCVEN